jgi:hypothetical protein
MKNSSLIALIFIYSCSAGEVHDERVETLENLKRSVQIIQKIRFSENEKEEETTLFMNCIAAIYFQPSLKELGEKVFLQLENYDDKILPGGEPVPPRTKSNCSWHFYYADESAIYKIETDDLENKKPVYQLLGFYFERDSGSGIIPFRLFVRYDEKLLMEEMKGEETDPETYLENVYMTDVENKSDDLYIFNFINKPVHYLVYAYNDLKDKKWVLSYWMAKISCASNPDA